jgi:hypothetical protein
MNDSMRRISSPTSSHFQITPHGWRRIVRKSGLTWSISHFLTPLPKGINFAIALVEHVLRRQRIKNLNKAEMATITVGLILCRSHDQFFHNNGEGGKDKHVSELPRNVRTSEL